MEKINAGIIKDMKSMIDSLLGGLERIFNVVTKDSSELEEGDFVMDGSVGSKKLKVIGWNNNGKVSAKITLTGKPTTTIKNIAEKDFKVKLLEHLKSEYGIEESDIKASRNAVIGLKKVMCKTGYDIVLTNVYADSSIDYLNNMLDTVVQSDELADQLTEEPMLFTVSETDDDFEMDVLDDTDAISDIERQNALDNQNAAVVINMLANVLFMESRTRFGSSLQVTELADQIRGLADNLFEIVAASVGDIDVGVGLLNDRVMGLLRDTDAGGDRFDIYAVMRDRIDFLDFFSINIISNESYNIHTTCEDLLDYLDKYTEMVFGYADGQ